MPISQLSNGKWRLTSPKDGSNLGTFDTKAEAEQHAGAVAYFANKAMRPSDDDEVEKRQRLSRLKLNYLSLVDHPANQHAHVILAKRLEKAAPMDYKAFSAAQLKAGKTIEEAAAAWEKLPADQKKSLARPQPDVGDVHIQTVTRAVVNGARAVGKLARTVAKWRGAAPSGFQAVVKDAVTFGDLLDDQQTGELVDALCQTLWSICDDDDSDADEKQDLIVQALKDFYSELTAADTDEPENPITKELDMTPEETQALVDKAIAKAVPLAVEPVRSELAKAIADNSALLAKNLELATTVEALRKADGRRTLLAKAERVLSESGAVGKAEDIADLLDGASPEHQEKILALVKQNGALASEGAIFKALGVSGEETPVGPDAQLERLALEKQAANPGMRIERARAEVLIANPDLYDEQQDAVAAAAGL